MSKTNDKVINKRLLRAAYHQAGHTGAYLLTNRSFEFVTINPDTDTLGYIEAPYNYWSVDLKSKSFYNPSCLMIFIENSFISSTGSIAERIYGFSYNSVSSHLDFQELENVTLSDLTEKLKTNYQKFLIQYTKEVLQKHWAEVIIIAEALYERRTLSYKQVLKIIKERFKKESKIII